MDLFFNAYSVLIILVWLLNSPGWAIRHVEAKSETAHTVQKVTFWSIIPLNELYICREQMKNMF